MGSSAEDAGATLAAERRRDGRASCRGAEPLLRPGWNCWRIEHAARAACLVDGEAYFAAAREALLKARRSVLLLGWNFAEETDLAPGAADPEWPSRIGELFHALVERRPELRIDVLVWDKAPFLALGRQRMPGIQAARMRAERLHYVLDTAHPLLTTHHQKVLVIDDCVAFCGGFDFAANRWDTRAHRPDDPRRRLPSGARYDAHHDVMLAVDGAAARALGELARARWRLATGERRSAPPPGLDAWPESLAPAFRDVPVAIARTAPAWRRRPAIREVERLYLDALAAARRTIYAESQYLASHRIGDALAVRLAEPDGPEIVIVNPKRSPSWTEQVAMDNARTEIARRLRAADRFGRFRLFAAVNRGPEIVVHSKVMVVDDRLLRIGSSNLNNRSLGSDTECDLAIEAGTSPADAPVRREIARFRDDLVAEHLGTGGQRVATEIAERGSLVAAIEALSGSSERRLAPFPPARARVLHRIEHNPLTDPLRPPGAHPALRLRSGRARLGWAAAGLVAVAGVAAAILRQSRQR